MRAERGGERGTHTVREAKTRGGERERGYECVRKSRVCESSKWNPKIVIKLLRRCHLNNWSGL